MAEVLIPLPHSPSDPIIIPTPIELSSSPSSSTIPPSLDESPSSQSSASMPSTPTNSNPFPISVQHSSSSNVVPAYPYNVSMLPQAHNGPTPDDSGISTRLPSICVDYLSHDWSEEDVWTSWKATTRHKSEIANGVRLENASWRTWAKQRGNLKTISPETLNWLKDSDVTWLYGPLHTAVEAVPPPRVATASERLGLDPLRSLSDSKRVQKNKKPLIITKPILKYRSLSDILLPPGTPASPVLEHINMDFDEDSTLVIQHARSDSNLVRLNNKKSPLASPRELSPDKSHTSDSSTSTSSTRYNGDRRHISFNHRVEQCIAVDSTEEAKKYSNDGSDEDDGDDEDEVLTFKSSARVTSFGPSSSIISSHPRHSSGREPHTIARLGPTTLKSTEIYPHPSPAVVYQNHPESSTSSGRQTAITYSATPPALPSPSIDNRAMYTAYSNNPTGMNASNQVGWNADDEEVEYGMGFDYFPGPDVGVGDEYDMAQYGSTHLVGGSHNNYQGGTSTYNSNGYYSSNSPENSTPSGSNHTSPEHSRQSSLNSKSSSANSSNSSSNSSSTSTIVGMRGPHSPTTSKDSLQPKRSILKNHRTTSSSGASFDDTLPSTLPPSPVNTTGPRFGAHIATPTGSNSPSPSGSPYGSASSLAVVMQSAGIPSSSSRSSQPSGVRRINSEEVAREGRGRSTSRGSSASLERSASADRRPPGSGSGSSVSPSSSYSPPSPVGSTSGARPIGIAIRGRNTSSDSLSSLGGTGGGVNLANGREVLPDLVEASSESETETLRAAGVDDIDVDEDLEKVIISGSPPLLLKNPVKGGIGGVLERNLVEVPTIIPSKTNTTTSNFNSTSTSILPSPSAASSSSAIPIGPPLIPVIPAVTTTSSSLTSALSSSQPSHTSIPSRYRQPSPSAPTTSVDDDSAIAITRVNSIGEIGNVTSLSNSPALDPIDLAGTPWSDENPVPSSARRSLLRASRGGGHHNVYGSDRNSLSNGDGNSSTSSLDRIISNNSGGNSGSGGMRGSVDSGIGSSHDDYGFGSTYYDEVLGEGNGGEAGLVGRTLEVAGTARDLIGAISKSLWSFGRRSS